MVIQLRGMKHSRSIEISELYYLGDLFKFFFFGDRRAAKRNPRMMNFEFYDGVWAFSSRDD